MTDTPLSEDDGALAGEYALGLLTGDEARDARARVLSDDAFAAEVALWHEKLARLADDVPDVVPAASAKRALFNRLFGTTAPSGAVGLWRTLTGLATTAAAVFAFLAFMPEQISEPPALFAAEVVSETGDLRVLAVVDATAHVVRLTLTERASTPGRVLELWGIPADGSGPVSFGLLPDTEAAGATAEFIVPDSLLGKAAGLVLAISDEPPGGSPTGAPTGAILATGDVLRL